MRNVYTAEGTRRKRSSRIHRFAYLYVHNETVIILEH